MADLIKQCYPRLPEGRLHVIPWGCWQDPVSTADVEAERRRLEAALGPTGSPTLLTLSRISPEKGLDTLLEALRRMERQGAPPVTVLIAGDAAYMRGAACLRGLQRRARRLRTMRVEFVGHANAAMKQALFSLADGYVFPSRHESYGLTLCEALAAGLPVITTDHYSARDLVPPGGGWIVPRDDPDALAAALTSVCQSIRHETGPRPGSIAHPPSFTHAAVRLANLIDSILAERPL
jgi:glycosyltransferase involved in cell wall biosynthesis